MSYVQDLISECYQAQGVEPKEADRMAGLALKVLAAVDVAPQDALERFERDAKIFHLRSEMRPCELKDRFLLSRSQLFDIIKRHGLRRRKALRAGMVA